VKHLRMLAAIATTQHELRLSRGDPDTKSSTRRSNNGLSLIADPSKKKQIQKLGGIPLTKEPSWEPLEPCGSWCQSCNEHYCCPRCGEASNLLRRTRRTHNDSDAAVSQMNESYELYKDEEAVAVKSLLMGPTDLFERDETAATESHANGSPEETHRHTGQSDENKEAATAKPDTQESHEENPQSMGQLDKGDEEIEAGECPVKEQHDDRVHQLAQDDDEVDDYKVKEPQEGSLQPFGQADKNTASAQNGGSDGCHSFLLRTSA